MATGKKTIGFNEGANEQTITTLLNNMYGQGISGAQSANVIRDPVTGKVKYVDVNLPVTAENKGKADAAVDATPGVAMNGPLLPLPAIITTVENITFAGAVKGGSTLAGSVYRETRFNTLFHNETVGNPNTAVQNNWKLATNENVQDDITKNFGVYVTSGVPRNILAYPHLHIQLLNADETAALTINDGDLVITHDGGQTLTITLTNPIVLPKAVGAAQGGLNLWVGEDGTVYFSKFTAAPSLDDFQFAGQSWSTAGGGFSYNSDQEQADLGAL